MFFHLPVSECFRRTSTLMQCFDVLFKLNYNHELYSDAHSSMTCRSFTSISLNRNSIKLQPSVCTVHSSVTCSAHSTAPSEPKGKFWLYYWNNGLHDFSVDSCLKWSTVYNLLTPSASFSLDIPLVSMWDAVWLRMLTIYINLCYDMVECLFLSTNIHFIPIISLKFPSIPSERDKYWWPVSVKSKKTLTFLNVSYILHI